MEFGSLTDFMRHLAGVTVEEELYLNAGLHVVAQQVQDSAQEAIGSYHDAEGGFPDWQPLAQSTMDDRVKQGYPADEPLLRSGELRDSIHHEVDALEAVVGSDSPIAAYQEFGTEHIPPRPFIGPAAFRNKEFIRDVLGVAAVRGIAGGQRLPGLPHYDFKINGEE